MVAPISKPTPPPLSTSEESSMKETDWDVVHAWMFNVGNTMPTEREIVRLYLKARRIGETKTHVR